ncbi:hypothetical protein OBBRIDRAFT_536961 [Obba rivulosa]|uniref:Uncharacterized protein n=1 Tax=Obba rivulosa TaxID=1052685 RepID=A0A8E2J683_9APHY|nr:hypothetical protein OBBRIDRAFT_536961 [Obba rivulosa]
MGPKVPRAGPPGPACTTPGVLSPTPSDSSRSSISSGSSSGWSNFSLEERMSYASSTTSLEEDAEQRITFGKNTFEKPRAAPSPPAASAPSAVAGVGSALWARVADAATAAGTLTINVGKAWTANITTYVGEETPPGQESRLTRAMKEYHIAKARDLTDLPEWLFDERERFAGRAKLADRTNEQPPPPMPEDTPRPPSRPSTPAGAKAAPRAGERKMPVRPPRPEDVPVYAPTPRAPTPRTDYTPPAALDRLKSTRLAKRTARVRFADDVQGGREEEPVRVPPVRPVTPGAGGRVLPPVRPVGERGRVGLPTSVKLRAV